MKHERYDQAVRGSKPKVPTKMCGMEFCNCGFFLKRFAIHPTALLAALGTWPDFIIINFFIPCVNVNLGIQSHTSSALTPNSVSNASTILLGQRCKEEGRKLTWKFPVRRSYLIRLFLSRMTAALLAISIRRSWSEGSVAIASSGTPYSCTAQGHVSTLNIVKS